MGGGCIVAFATPPWGMSKLSLLLMQQKDPTSSQAKSYKESMKLLKNLSSFTQLQDLTQF